MTEQSKHKRHVVSGAALVILLLVFVPPLINANLFKARLARSVSNALGRNITMGNVNIRLLPLPGFEIHDFVVMDDPAFSAEPMLRAESVTARLRLTSLWRGRLEIARLSIAYPSLNLVRNAEGHWNIESLLAHATQVSAAPTAEKKPESRLRFPYVEADTGRINFKVLQEKKAHALVEADFSLWQEAENQWNMRLEARPTRTDANLGDTGTLRVDASFQRADSILTTPMKVNIDWQKAQLGQLTTLIFGRDRGWRGDVHIAGTVEGMPKQFDTKFSAVIENFHRYDIGSDDFVRITADCAAHHVTVPDQQAFRNTLQCVAPFAPGAVELKAYGQYWSHGPSYASVRVSGVPVSALAQLYRHAKLDVPPDLTGDGMLNAYFSHVSYPDADHPRWIGQGTLTNVHIASASLGDDFIFESAHFGFNQVEQSPEGPQSSGLKLRIKTNKSPRDLPATANIFTVDPFKTDLGGATSLIVGGTNSPAGLQLQVKGDADVKQLKAAAQLFGLQLPATAQSVGLASVDYNIAGRWTGFAAPEVTGTLRATAARPASTHPTETASNQQHAKTTKPVRQ